MIFNFICSVLCKVVCPFVSFPLAIVLSVRCRFANSDYPFGMSKLIVSKRNPGQFAKKHAATSFSPYYERDDLNFVIMSFPYPDTNIATSVHVTLEFVFRLFKESSSYFSKCFPADINTLLKRIMSLEYT